MKQDASQSRPHSATVAGGILAVLAAVYFLCPPVLEIPVYIWYYHRHIPSGVWGDLAVFYAPLGHIGRSFPVYMKLLNSEEALFMKLGQRDPSQDKVIGDE